MHGFEASRSDQLYSDMGNGETTDLWKPLSLKNACHLAWLSFNVLINASLDSFVTPGKRAGARLDGASEGSGKNVSSSVVL